MANLEKINFGTYGYHAWLVGKINGMKKALEAGESFEHSAGAQRGKRRVGIFKG